ncbi:hypothetical protein FZC35_02045 [Candidatus Cytomitobacter indipagum]|uniref:Uncharacterized protein n=1 Tax=Candidatus Cytomitobacter indipagum TaxID=2601575 RepID=A0A5C0UDN6_9PROT|nr:hypothetical protein [Candidatus Cytomitobacter indipagum]QEK38146.1 hypothetical protein FZC35_02045 [Candidatus Cytomitobacter indipagum]
MLNLVSNIILHLAFASSVKAIDPGYLRANTQDPWQLICGNDHIFSGTSHKVFDHIIGPVSFHGNSDATLIMSFNSIEEISEFEKNIEKLITRFKITLKNYEISNIHVNIDENLLIHLNKSCKIIELKNAFQNAKWIINSNLNKNNLKAMQHKSSL